MTRTARTTIGLVITVLWNRGDAMNKPLVTKSAFVSLFLAAWISKPGIVEAQLVTEEIHLESGWNAVWVNLEPEPNDLEQILAQQSPPLDYQAIWTFDANRGVSSLLPEQSPGRWLLHDRDVPPEVTSLRTLLGHRAYLINMRSTGRLRLDGRPLIRTTHFASRVSNLFGALSDPASNPLSFEEFFSPPGATGKVRASGSPVRPDIFALVGGVLQRRTLADPIQPNVAYWCNVVQDFDCLGTLDASANINGLSFGRTTALQTLALEVPSSQSTRTVRLEARPCAVLSTEGQCFGAEEAARWLEYRDATQGGVAVWHSLADGLDVVVPAGGTRIEIELRARRSGLESAARSSNIAGASSTFPLVIDVSDQQGSRSVIASDVVLEPIFGRWVGLATLTQVSAHPAIQQLPLDQAEAPPMTMTLLLDLPDAAAGGAGPRLLDSVNIQGFRDGRAVTRSFNSILLDRPVNLTVDASDALDPFGASGTLRGTLHIQPDDPLNPYRHRYNPEHREGYDITREITIKIESQADSLSDELSGLDGTFGPHRLTGQYTEVITGITAQPITVRGTFRLERLSEGAGSP